MAKSLHRQDLTTGRCDGFTLLETLVALFVLGLAMAALISASSSSLDSGFYLQQTAVAQWVAENKASEIQLYRRALLPGRRSGVVDMANARWYWRTRISTTPDPAVYKVEISVSLQNDRARQLARLVTYANR